MREIIRVFMRREIVVAGKVVEGCVAAGMRCTLRSNRSCHVARR